MKESKWVIEEEEEEEEEEESGNEKGDVCKQNA